MALGNVILKDTDGNIPSASSSPVEQITGLLFDTSLRPSLFGAGYGKTNQNKLKLNDVILVTSCKSAIEEFGIIKRADSQAATEDDMNFMNGIPYYHIEEFFRMKGDVGGSGHLYVMFADCSKDWNAIETMQRVAGGRISQLGIFTEQPIWKINGNADKYSLDLVSSINAKAVSLSAINQPLSIVLSANYSNTGGSDANAKMININKIPNAISELRYLSVIFGQARSQMVSTMQKRSESSCPVGFIGAMMGAIASAPVGVSVAWVQRFNMFSDNFQNIELGFGDVTKTDDGNFVSTNALESISPVVLDDLDEKGYIFPIKYTGRENGVYISKDRTLSNGDYRTISRNRVINKSRREIRTALLPLVNSPVFINPSTGYMDISKTSEFKQLVDGVLDKMRNSQEIAGYQTSISATQNVLVDGVVRISYKIIPYGTSEQILVEEGLALNTK